MISAGSNPIHKMTRRTFAWSSCGLCFALCSFSRLGAEPLTIDLVSEVASIQPGSPFYVGLYLKHKEHYHTYWKFPGIVGVPTGMTWDLPPGWKADPIEWPAPERVMMFRIKAQGFHGEVLLPMKLTPPKDLPAGQKITLKGRATWMCCGLDCNPGFADLSVTLPVDELPAPLDMRREGLFNNARARMPQPLVGYEATAVRNGDRVTLRLAAQTAKEGTPEPPRNLPAGIFFTEDGYINADKDQTFRQEGRTLVIELITSSYFTETPPDELRGILWLYHGSLGRGAIIRVPFAK